MTIAELIADKLATGLFHPGDPETEQAPMTIPAADVPHGRGAPRGEQAKST